MTFPHINPGGINQFSPRDAPQSGRFRPVYLKFNVGKLSRTMVDRAENLRRTDTAIIAANKYLAEDVQYAIAEVLRKRVKETARAQRDDQPDPAEGRLYKAIMSERNRDVKLDGYTVGYLDRFPEIDPYYRGLEYGSDVFLGRFLRGSFKNAAGQFVRPIEGGKDPKFVQFQPHVKAGHPSLNGGHDVDVKLFPGVLIRNAIKPYHYFQEGVASTRQQGFFGREAIDVYITFFYSHGFDAAGDIFKLALSGAGGGSVRTTGLRNTPTPPR